MFHILVTSPYTAICNILNRLEVGMGFVTEQEEKVSKTERFTYHKGELTGREEADIQVR